MGQRQPRLDRRYLRTVLRKHETSPGTWELVLSCHHGAVRHRCKSPPEQVGCGRCADEDREASAPRAAG